MLENIGHQLKQLSCTQGQQIQEAQPSTCTKKCIKNMAKKNNMANCLSSLFSVITTRPSLSSRDLATSNKTLVDPSTKLFSTLKLNRPAFWAHGRNFVPGTWLISLQWYSHTLFCPNIDNGVQLKAVNSQEERNKPVCPRGGQQGHLMGPVIKGVGSMTKNRRILDDQIRKIFTK